MNEKKTPKASLEDKRVSFLLIGFVTILSLVYIGLEWTKSEMTIYDSINTDFLVEDQLDVIQTSQDQTPPPPPPPPAPEVVDVLNIVDNSKETNSIEINTEEDKNKIVEINTAQVVPVIEEDDNLFAVVETMPKFPGGDAALIKFLNNNLKYPFLAEKNRIQGRVICQFIVNVDGSISNIIAVGGVDANLEKEAIRVLKLMPKWSPGKQLGKAVKVKYTMPVIFALQ